MSDDVSEDRPQHRELRPLLLVNPVAVDGVWPLVTHSNCYHHIDDLLNDTINKNTARLLHETS